MRKLLVLGSCLVAAALFFAACGGSESDEDKIVEAIEASATSTDPADCKAVNTQAFLEQSEFEEGKEAVESCEDSADDGEGKPEEVTVSEVEVDGSTATAQAAIVGGSFDGQTLSIGLVEEDGDWKVDEWQSFVVFNKGRLLASLESTLSEEAEGGEDEEASTCLLEEMEAASDEEVEEAVLQPDAFVELVEGCFK